jgi:hypothetical protein
MKERTHVSLKTFSILPKATSNVRKIMGKFAVSTPAITLQEKSARLSLTCKSFFLKIFSQSYHIILVGTFAILVQTFSGHPSPHTPQLNRTHFYLLRNVGRDTQHPPHLSMHVPTHRNTLLLKAWA